MKVKLEFFKCMGIMLANLCHPYILSTTVLSDYGYSYNTGKAWVPILKNYNCYFVFVMLQYGRTPLYLASLRGHLVVVKLLIEKGADANIYDKVCTMYIIQTNRPLFLNHYIDGPCI